MKKYRSIFVSKFAFVGRLALVAVLFSVVTAGAAEKLTVGVTLHPYYSWVANIAGDAVNLRTIIPENVDPHSYQMRPQDLTHLQDLDVIVINGLGHDDYIEDMLKAAGKENIKRIEPNKGLPLITAASKKYTLQSKKNSSQAYNSHTYVSLVGAVQQVNTIARELGELIPEKSSLFNQNARRYSKKLRKLLRKSLAALEAGHDKSIAIATVHDGYAYLFQELGIKTDAVIQPRHGIEPSARQLADTIKRIKRTKVNVLFTEVDYQKKYVDTIFAETGCRMYSLSHISTGLYTSGKFEQDMRENLNTIVNALAKNGGSL